MWSSGSESTDNKTVDEERLLGRPAFGGRPAGRDEVLAAFPERGREEEVRMCASV